MSCVCKDNHLLRCCIDIYCSRTLYTDELEELKLAGRQHDITACNYHTHSTPSLYSTNTHTLNSCLSLSLSLSHIATDGLSVCLSWCRAPSGAHDQIVVTV
jgi:hypothetical protein